VRRYIRVVAGDPTIPDPDGRHITVPDAELASGVTMRMPEPPKVIGGWNVGRRLGQGGMGAVHLAEKDGQQGALKILHASLVGQGDFRARFLRESEVLASVRHPNVVQLIGHGESEGWLWLVMEYVAGGDLAGHLKRRGTLLEKEACTIAARCARGLVAIHAAGLIHRDLKPENIFLQAVKASAMPEPKIGDLGMARHAEGDDRMTMTGTACGTPAYMAPEQIRGEGDLDHRVDVYALGATLYTLLTGRKPFDGPTIYVLTHEVLTRPVPDMRRFSPHITPAVCGVVEKAMSKDREHRHRDIGELLLDLERLAEGKAPMHSTSQSPASMVFAEVTGSPSPKRIVASNGSAFTGIPWGPILRLGLPALLIIGGLTAATWLLERKTRPASGQPPVPGRPAAATVGAMERDEIGAIVRLPVAGQTATLRWCPPGRFVMGSPPGEPGREPCEELHAVQLSQGFWMSAGEVSNALYGALAEGGSDLPPELPASELPLETCLAWLERLNRLHPGLGARLPSEAEWEYACRAGTTGAFGVASQPRICTVPAVLAAWRDGGLFAAENAWLLDRDQPLLRPLPVTADPVNAWGFAGMHGNVAEWCLDRWDGESPYGDQQRSDPVGQFGGLNVIRGGSWLHPAHLARSAARGAANPSEAKAWLGFRFLVPGGSTASWPPR
jgi:serine/threonine protein kinase/formylglycine-generating enzyme required for sulfatase activity